jgi:glycosyltransferase involved in cell wall biosynthesis
MATASQRNLTGLGLPVIALLGRRDQPTDALEDYCCWLGDALEKQGYDLALVRMPWPERGWLSALNWLRAEGRKWDRGWVLVQYTALGWSRRGVPLMFLAVLVLLRICGIRVAVVFHDPHPYSGRRFVDKARRMCQHWVMRCTYWFSDKVILTIPLPDVSWLQPASSKATFIPVGANIPIVFTPDWCPRDPYAVKTIAVFGITGDGNVGNEVSDIAFVAKAAARHLPGIHLVTLGRGSLESEPKFRAALDGSTVEYRALGVISAEEVASVLSRSDVSLFVRGCISTQRGSAIASIASAVPLVAYAGDKLAAPLSEAGVVAVPFGDRERLADAAVNILTDRALWLELHQRSQEPYQKYFSWEAVAGRFVEFLNHA